MSKKLCIRLLSKLHSFVKIVLLVPIFMTLTRRLFSSRLVRVIRNCKQFLKIGNKIPDFYKQSKFRKKSISPLTHFDLAGDPRDHALGQTLLHEGKVGAIVLAGGQGSRLNWPGPKGTYPLLKKVTLFQLLAEKIHPSLPLAIMTSPLNHEETVSYFEKNHYFGLSNIHFFSQSLLPFVDEDGKLLSEEGPCGNGEVFAAFAQSKILEKWQEMGIETLSLLPIDNPLADPFDPTLIGYHARKRADVTVKAILRENQNEQVGVIGESEGKLHVVEYFELTEEQRALPWQAAHITLFCFTLKFFDQMKIAELPWHYARKGSGFKREKFIFDCLPLAKEANVLVYPREKTYAPLKNASGVNSPETVLRAINFQASLEDD